MHFKCIKCPYEFCSGCGQLFKQGQVSIVCVLCVYHVCLLYHYQECGKLESCKKKGLHAHHPRDCLFYMRDFDVAELQSFLTQHKIPFDTIPKETAAKAEDEPAKAEQGERLYCGIINSVHVYLQLLLMDLPLFPLLLLLLLMDLPLLVMR